MSTPVTQSPFDQASQAFSQAHLMKLFPGGCPGPMSPMTPVTHQTSTQANIFRGSGAGSVPVGAGALQQSMYPADFSNYGPMYSSYYAKQVELITGFFRVLQNNSTGILTIFNHTKNDQTVPTKN